MIKASIEDSKCIVLILILWCIDKLGVLRIWEGFQRAIPTYV